MLFLQPLIDTALHQTAPWVLWGVALLAGILSSVLPCSLSMTPIVLAYLTQNMAREVIPEREALGGTPQRWQTWIRVVCFMAGSATTLSILGVVSSRYGLVFGSWLNPYTYTVLALVTLLMAASVMGYWTLHIPRCMAFAVPETLRHQASRHPVAAFLLGVLFGVVGSPCATPFLVAMLGFMSTTKQWAVAGIALWLYAFGRGIPLLVLASGFQAQKLSSWLLSHHEQVKRISGLCLMGVGLWLLYEGWH